MANSNRCIRNNRDAQQIKRCKQFLINSEKSLSYEAKLYALLGNSVRLKIINLLKMESRLCVCDISEILGMTTPSISQHLKKLRNEKIVFTEREGNTIYNRLDSKYKHLLKAEAINKTTQINMAYER